MRYLYSRPRFPSKTIDFTNAHVVTLRLVDERFRDLTEHFEHFVPDSSPLTWCVNLASDEKKMPDRVYGPRFFQLCVDNSPAIVRHYFLGASQACLEDLLGRIQTRNPVLSVAGSHHGYFGKEEWEKVLDRIHAADPDLIWVGLGTPKQQEFAHWLRGRLKSGVVLLVGFAFDVYAGWKPDAPRWMQRIGMTWFFRLMSEPRRLFGRYLKYNSLFLIYATEWLVTWRLVPELLRRGVLTGFLGLGLGALIVVWSFLDLPHRWIFLLNQLAMFVGFVLSGLLGVTISDLPEERYTLSRALFNHCVFLSGAATAVSAIAVPTLYMGSTVGAVIFSVFGLVLSWLAILLFSAVAAAGIFCRPGR